jgi:hypothetical protein
MNITDSLEIIRILADGIDPHTGEKFLEDTPYQHPQTIQALFVAIQALERVKKIDDRRGKLPDNAGTPWDKLEDERLISAFDSGKTIKQLSEEHERTEGSIRSRLTKHGKILI